jgi:predicted dehydrogenase
VKDFLEAIDENRPFVSPAEDGRAVVALIQGIYRSSRERRPVAL